MVEAAEHTFVAKLRGMEMSDPRASIAEWRVARKPTLTEN